MVSLNKFILAHIAVAIMCCIGHIQKSFATDQSAESHRPDYVSMMHQASDDAQRSASQQALQNATSSLSTRYKTDTPDGIKEAINSVKKLTDETVEGIRKARRGLGIANPELQDERDKVMQFMGLSDEERLLIFISTSMPDDMIQAYALEAMWSGGVLVLKGIPAGMTLNEFIKGTLVPLASNKGAGAAIQIDPNLFDVYGVESVPEIVYSSTPVDGVCVEQYDDKFEYKGRSLTHSRCKPEPEDRYVKLRGAVTLDWALEQFVEQGWQGAQTRLDSLRSIGLKTSQEQKGFNGDWGEIPTPDYREFFESQGWQSYDTEEGTVYGPPGIDDEITQ